MRTFALMLWLIVSPAATAVEVFACEPEWAALVKELGGERVYVRAATTASQDPHRVEARPSLIAALRGADLLVCAGADLEAGWVPVLLRQAGNARVQPGRPGHFLAAEQVARLEVPERVDRALGHVHAAGNPHVHLDPRRLTVIAEKLAARLAEVDPAGADQYARRHAGFAERWAAAVSDWEEQAAPLAGTRVVVDHGGFVYLFDWLGLEQAGSLEPKPGLPPSAAHLAELARELEAEPAAMVVYAAYQDPRPAGWLSDRSGIPVVELPFTVGGSEEADDLLGLYQVTLDRLLGALP